MNNLEVIATDLASSQFYLSGVNCYCQLRAYLVSTNSEILNFPSTHIMNKKTFCLKKERFSFEVEAELLLKYNAKSIFYTVKLTSKVSGSSSAFFDEENDKNKDCYF